MEIFGLIIAAGFGLFAAPLYCLFVAKLLTRSARLSVIAFYSGVTILLLLLGTLVPTIIFGVTATHERMGSAFNIIRGFCLLLAAPALGTVLLLGKRTLCWPITAGLCWLVGLAGLLLGIYVSETLYGVDGQGPPAFDSTDLKSK